MITQTGLSACNFCGTNQANPSQSGWVHLPGTVIDACPACVTKPLADIWPAFRLRSVSTLQGAPGTVAAPQQSPDREGASPSPATTAQRVEMPSGAKVTVPAGGALPAGARVLSVPPAPPGATPLKS